MRDRDDRFADLWGLDPVRRIRQRPIPCPCGSDGAGGAFWVTRSSTGPASRRPGRRHLPVRRRQPSSWSSSGLTARSAGGACSPSRISGSTAFFIRTPFAAWQVEDSPELTDGRHARRRSLPGAQPLALRGAGFVVRRSVSTLSRRHGAAALDAAARRGRAARLEARRTTASSRRAGARQSEAAGRALAALGEEFAACYASPKVRAWETAELACARLNIEPVREDALADGFSRVDALTLLRRARRRRTSSSSATSRRSRRSSTTSPAAAWTSRRAASPRSRPRAPPASCSCSLRPRELEATRPGAKPQLAPRGSRPARPRRAVCSDASSTNSSGLCALPPRGPRPSTVIGIVAAKWLASRAPPRAAGAIRRPSAALARVQQRRASAVSECMPGQRRISSASRRTLVVLGGDVGRARPRSRRGRRRARRSRARRGRGRR